MKAFKLLFGIFILLAVMNAPAWADTLVLKNGESVTGSFDGGTARVVKFRSSSGGVKEYDILSVQQILFSDETKTAVRSTTSPATSTTFPAGSKISVRMVDSIGSENQTAGSLFLASLDAPMMDHGVEVIPKGADVWERVTGSGPLRLELTLIVVDGNSYFISTGDYKAAGSNIPTESKLEFTLKEPLVIGAREEL